MDSRIILAGQMPNFVNVLAESNQAAQQQTQFKRQNALANFTQANGAALVSGDQNALAGYAGLAGPEAALGLQSARQDMQATSQRMAMLTREEQRAIEQHAATLTAAERAAEAQKVEDAVKMGLAIQDPQEWDRVMQAQSPDLVGQFDNRQALAQRFMSMAEILKKQQDDAARTAGPDWRPATPEEAARYGAAGGQINGRTGQFTAINPPSGFSLTTNPDGTTSFQQGPGAGGAKPFTEGQGKDIGFAARGRAALEAFEPVADALTSRGNRMLDYVPLGIGREFQSGDFQVAQNAGDTFLLSLLRKDTGAAVTEGEQQIYGGTFLPQPGDGPRVLAQKKQARELAIAGIEQGMSPEQILAQGRAMMAGGSDAQSSGAQPPQGMGGREVVGYEPQNAQGGAAPAMGGRTNASAPAQAGRRTNAATPGQQLPAYPPNQPPQQQAAPQGVDPSLWEFMTPEERNLFQ